MSIQRAPEMGLGFFSLSTTYLKVYRIATLNSSELQAASDVVVVVVVVVMVVVVVVVVHPLVSN